MATKRPLDLEPGDVLVDGFAIKRGPSKADFRNRVRVWGVEHDGAKGWREFNINLDRVEMQ